MQTPIYLWVLTLVVFACLLAFDLIMASRRAERPTLRQSATWIAVYVAIAIGFGIMLLALGRGASATAFFAGYLTEYSLSVDNLFVFVLIMTRFKVPDVAEENVLLIGIVGSLVLRGLFIVAGTALISVASWMFFVFGALLIYTAIKLILDNGEPDEVFEEGRILRALRSILPLAPTYSGQRIMINNGTRRLLTPLILPIAAIAGANFIFALDSMPAIFGLTQDPFVILAANAFALLGLRQLYFLIEGLLAKLIYLNYGLAAILAFIGLKLVDTGLIAMGIHHLGGVAVPEIGTGLSMGIIVAVLAVATVASVIGSARKSERVRAEE